MKNLLATSCLPLTFLLSFFLFDKVSAQQIALPNEVAFKIGDHKDWSNLSFNDIDWKKQQLGSGWSTEDVKDSVYAWYRIKIVVPSSMKELATNGKGIKLNLGKIDDVDQTFFNGKLIGQTGSFPPHYETKWDVARKYIIPVEEVIWDKENIIAVRMYNAIGGAGMYEGPYDFGPIQWSDFVSTQTIISETSNKGFITKVKFINSRDVAFDGIVKYRIENKNSIERFTETKPVHLEPSKNFEATIAFTNYQSADEEIFKVEYVVVENGTSASLRYDQIYLANRNIKLPVASKPSAIILNKVKDAYSPASFEDVHLKGYLRERFTQNLEERLLKVDEDGLMGSYLHRPGIHPWAGEHVGKYLETASHVWENTKDARLKNQMDRMMFELINTQQIDGYLGTYTPDKYWTSWDVWSHKYNLYGLLAYYKTTGYEPALLACKKMGDLLCITFGNKPGQRDIILAGTHVGMAATSVLDPMVDLYRYTGDKKYLDFCYYILDAWEHENGPKIISRLLSTSQVNKVGNGKAYEMLSNFLGLINFYRLTGDEKMLKPVLIAWQDIVDKRLYITGTTSAWEYFQDDSVLPAAEESHMGEGCVTTTWLQLNQALFALTGDIKYFDQLEKTVYNHLLAAENPQTGCVSYYTPLMGKKPYTCHITCCQSSVPRGIALIPNSIFGMVGKVPTLLTYEAGSYKGRTLMENKTQNDLSLEVQSNFPESGEVTITVNVSQSQEFSIALRVPSWSNSFKATFGNKEYEGQKNEFLTITRKWKSGDKIAVIFNMPVHTLKGGKSYPDQIAFQRGPQVLALDEALNDAQISTIISSSPVSADQINKVRVNSLPHKWSGNQLYEITEAAKTINHSPKLVPFADASQTGGIIKVWLPIHIKE